MDTDRVTAMPSHLQYAAVKQQLNASKGEKNYDEALKKLLRSDDEVVVSAALDVLSTKLEDQNAALKAIRLLAGIARVAQDNIAQLLLSSITETFLSATPGILADLDPGDPFLTIADTAPHLSPLLGVCVHNMLMRLASPLSSPDRTEAFLSHLRPFMLRCISGRDGLAHSVASALARAAWLYPHSLPAAVSCMVLHLETTNEDIATSDIPLHLLDLLQHPEWPSDPTILKRRAMLAMLSWLPVRSSPQSPQRLTITVVTMAASPKSPTSPQDLYAMILKLVPAAVSASSTAAEGPILQLLHVCLKAALSSTASLKTQPTALLSCLKPQLIHHLSLPTPSAIQALSRAVLSLDCLRDVPPAQSLLLPQPTFEAHLASIMHKHTSTSLPSATIHFLHSLTRRASLSIPSGPKQERFESVIAALSTASLWPQAPGCCPAHTDSPPSHSLHSPTTPLPPFSPHPLLIAHVATLLRHPLLPCALAAAGAIIACAFAAPDSMVPLFPYLLASARSTLASASEAATDGVTRPAPHPAALLLPFLLLAVTPQSPYLDGPFFGVCAQLLADSNGPRIHALGLRMLVTFWLATGRGYQRVRVALLAFETPSPEAMAAGRGGAERAAPLLRRAVAAAVVAVARESPDKAADMVSVMHGALRDDDDAAAAAGLEAIGAMCQHDALDMYGAWRVIVAVHPKLPAAPQTRVQWLLVLAHGALDGREHPDQLQDTLALLWGALRQSTAAVRAAAAAAIAQYPLDLLEELEASRPLRELCESRWSGTALEHLLCFQALIVRALSHEHSHRRALVATSAPQATSSQRSALQKRLMTMLPQKLLERHPGVAVLPLELCALGERAQTQRSMAVLQGALETVQWSAVPEVSGETPLATIQAAFSSFVNWALEAGGVTDTDIHSAIMQQLGSPSSTTARNAPLALGSLFATTPLPPGSPSSCVAALTDILATPASLPPVAAGAAVGAAAVLAVQPDADETSMRAVLDAVLARIATDAHADAESAAAELVALGELAASYGLHHRDQHPHARELVQRVFTLTVHIISERMPAMHDHIVLVVQKLPEDWSAAVDADLQAVIDAMSRLGLEDSGACEAAAARVLLRLLEASSAAEADLLAVLVIAVLQLSRAQDGDTPRGAEVAALAGMPRVLCTLQANNLEGHITLIQEADLPAEPWASPRDGCHLAAAVRARSATVAFSLQAALNSSSTAQHATQHGPEESQPSAAAAVDAAAAALKAAVAGALRFVEELFDAVQRGKKLQRSQHVAVGVAHACAELVAVAVSAPEIGAAAAAGIGKAALKVWEGLVFGAGVGGIPATLLATCCKEVHASASHMSATTSALKPLSSFPPDGAMATVAPLVLQDPASTSYPAGAPDRVCTLATAAAALCRAPWIAQADWAVALQHHMHAPHAWGIADALVTDACARLELMNMVITHGHHRGSGPAQWLASSVRSAAAWAAIPLYVRTHAFLWLPRLLDMLPPPAQDCLLLRAEEAARVATRGSVPDSVSPGVDVHTVPLVGKVQLCAVCAGTAACVGMLCKATAAALSPERQRLQEKVLLLLQKLLGSIGVLPEWAEGSVRLLPEPSDLPFRLGAASLMHQPAIKGVDAAALPREAGEGAVVLLGRACMHDCTSNDAEEEAAAAALAVWASGRPTHTFPHPPSSAELQQWGWACLAAAYSAMPAKTLHEVLVSPPRGGDTGGACSTCMRWLAFGLVGADLSVHGPAATQLLLGIAEGPPGAATREVFGEWVAAAAACATAVVGGEGRQAAVAKTVTEVLNSARETAEGMTDDSGEGGTQQRQGGVTGGGLLGSSARSRSVRWKLTVVSLVAWHAQHVHQQDCGVTRFADFLAWPGGSNGDGYGVAWEMPLRVLDTTIAAIVAEDGTKPSAGRNQVVQALFELWRELEVKGDSCAGYLLRPLQSLWQWLIQRDQALMVPYLEALQ